MCGWKYLSIPKLERCNRWSLGMDKLFHPTVYWACDYLSMLGLKSNHVSNRGYLKQIGRMELSPWWLVVLIGAMCVYVGKHQTLSHSPCTALKAGNFCLIIRAVNGDCEWPLKINGYSHQSHEAIMPCTLPRIHWTCRHPSKFRPAKHTRDDPGLISSPAAIRRGLFNSLLVCHRVPLSAHLPSLQQNYSTWLLCTTTSGAKAHSTHSQNLLQRITRIQCIFNPQNAVRYIDLVFLNVIC